MAVTVNSTNQCQHVIVFFNLFIFSNYTFLFFFISILSFIIFISFESLVIIYFDLFFKKLLQF
jgi:hypothetical protein